MVNLIAVMVLVITTRIINLELYGVFIGLFVNYSVASALYMLKYKKTVHRIKRMSGVEIQNG